MTFYDPGDGGWIRSNHATIGSWDPHLQHGAPPVALLALHLETLAASKNARIARLSYDFLSSVPVADLAVTTEVIRPGTRIQLSSAVLRTADRVVLRATAWHVTAEPGRSTPVTPSSSSSAIRSLFDIRGAIGRALQTLFVAPRAESARS